MSASKPTPFHSRTAHLVQGGFWYGWGDYILPDVYSSATDELAAVRTSVAMGDMSPLPKYSVSGPGAAQLLDLVMTRPVKSLGVGHCLYSPWCEPGGLVIGDGLIFRTEKDRFFVSGERSLKWFQSVAERHDFVATVEDITDRFGILALQGPQARSVVRALCGNSAAALEFSTIARIEVGGAAVMLARQGFTGEIGFEFWCKAEDGARVWDAVWEAAKPYNAQPVGEYAIDLARVEAGLILVSADYAGAGGDGQTANVIVDHSLTVTPNEIGLGRLVPLDSARDFIGRVALEKAAADGGPRRHLLGLRADPAAISIVAQKAGRADEALSRVLWGSVPLSVDGRAVGRASSLCYSPTLRSAIAFALVERELKAGDEVTLAAASPSHRFLGNVPATLCPLPFVDVRRSALV